MGHTFRGVGAAWALSLPARNSLTVRGAIPESCAYGRHGWEMIMHTEISGFLLLRQWEELSDSFPTTKIKELFEVLERWKRK